MESAGRELTEAGSPDRRTARGEDGARRARAVAARAACMALLLAVFAVAAMGLTVVSAKSYAGTTLRIALPNGYDEALAFAEAARRAAERLGLKIEVLWYTVDQLHEKLLLDFRMKNRAWDIVFIATTSVAEWMEMGLVTPVGDFVQANPGVVDPALLAKEDFVPRAVQDFTYKGHWVGFPLYATGVALAWRADLFEHPIERANFKARYGYELAPPETYKQFRDIAEFFTRRKGETLAGRVLTSDFYGTVHSNKPTSFLWYDFVNYLIAFGADDIYDPKTMRPTFNSPAAVAAAEYYVSLVPFMPPGHMTMTSGEATALFAQGHVAMQIEYFQRLTSVALNPEQSPYAGVIDFGPLPSVEGVSGRNHAAHAGGNAVGLYALSEHKEAAYKLLELAFSRDIMKATLLSKYRKGGWVPPRVSVLSDPEVQQALPWMKRALERLFADDIYYFQLSAIPEYYASIDIAAGALSEALAGKKSVREALNEAQEQLIGLFTKAGYIKSQ